jgi:hypothetical protein
VVNPLSIRPMMGSFEAALEAAGQTQ